MGKYYIHVTCIILRPVCELSERFLLFIQAQNHILKDTADDADLYVQVPQAQVSEETVGGLTHNQQCQALTDRNAQNTVHQTPSPPKPTVSAGLSYPAVSVWILKINGCSPHYVSIWSNKLASQKDSLTPEPQISTFKGHYYRPWTIVSVPWICPWILLSLVNGVSPLAMPLNNIASGKWDQSPGYAPEY